MHASQITNFWGEIEPRRVAGRELLIFRGCDGKGYNHQPQLLESGGVLFATWSMGEVDEEAPGQQLVLATSLDWGETWTAPRVLAACRAGRYGRSVIVSTGMVRTEDGLVAFYGEFERSEDGLNSDGTRTLSNEYHQYLDPRTYAICSGDGGNTWSEPVLVAENRYAYMPPCRTSRGRWVLPGHLACHHTEDPFALRGWRRSALPGLPADFKDVYEGMHPGNPLVGSTQRFNEACCFESAPGVVRMMFRNEWNLCAGKPFLGMSESTDEGETWSPPAVTGFSDNVCRAHFGRMNDGRFFAVNCPENRESGSRSPVVLALSADGCNYREQFLIGDEPVTGPRVPGYAKSGRYGYPYFCESHQWGFVIYSVNKEDIAVTRFPMSGL